LLAQKCLNKASDTIPTYWQAIETICKSLPQFYVVTSLALIIETIDSKAISATSFTGLAYNNDLIKPIQQMLREVYD